MLRERRKGVGMRSAGDVVGGYTVERELGRGGQAIVYLATGPKGAEVALKCLLSNEPGARERFKREVELLSECQHENIVRCLGSNLARGDEWVALPYANGGTLENWLRNIDSIDPEDLLVIFLPIARALDYFKDLSSDANEPQQHRDVKPSNILLLDGKPMLADFGVARTPQSTLTQTGDFIGTHPYAAPEQMQSQHSGAVDQYALATIIYEWLAGQLPFADPNQKLTSAASRDLLNKRRTDPRAQTVLLKALATNPNDRYGSCVEFVSELISAFAPQREQKTQPGAPIGAEPRSLKFNDVPQVYDDLHARLLTCEFSGTWVQKFSDRFAGLNDQHNLRPPINLSVLADWLRDAPPSHMRILLFAIAECLPIPNDEAPRKLVLELLVFAACRVLNLDYFLQATTRRVSADPKMDKAAVRQWPTSASTIAGIVHAALSGRFIAVDRHCRLAGAIKIDLEMIRSIDGMSEILTLLYGELLGRKFDPAQLASDDNAMRQKKIIDAWAPVRKALADRELRKQALVMVLVPPEKDPIDRGEREELENSLATMINDTLYQLNLEGAVTLAEHESDLLLRIQEVLNGFELPAEVANKPTAGPLPYDIFISYASEDGDFVRELITHLKTRGARVWVDYVEMELNAILLQKINDGLSKSRFCAALLSEHYLPKFWTSLESSGALAIEANGLRSMLLPIRHQMTVTRLTEIAPLWAGRIFADSDHGAEALADAIWRRIKP